MYLPPAPPGPVLVLGTPSGAAALSPLATLAGLSPACFEVIAGPDDVASRVAACARADQPCAMVFVPASALRASPDLIRRLLRQDPDVPVVVVDATAEDRALLSPPAPSRVVLLPAGATPEDAGQTLRLALAATMLERRLRRTLALPGLSDEEEDDGTGRPLDELPGRSALERRLRGELETARTHPGYEFALLLVDVDRFHTINEGLGHRHGDRVLRDLASGLAATLGPRDVLAWLGADRFAAVLGDTRGVEDVLPIARRLHNSHGRTVSEDGHVLPLTTSIGAVRVCGGPRIDAAEVISRADLALSAAKARGGARIDLFDAATHGEALIQRDLRAQVLPGLVRGEFQLVYQPVVRLADRSIHGFEALLRWNHPTRGLLAPGLFIPVLENAGIMGQVGDWVIEEVCREGLAIQQASTHPGLTLCLNVSPCQLLDPSFALRTVSRLKRSNLDPRTIGFELTESTVVEPFDAVGANLQRLRAAGCQILLDDFGMGYSCLAALHRLPIDVLKIDREFVHGAAESSRRRCVARAVADLGHGLGLPLIAEGIETEEELAEVRGLGCEFGQGYLFARPGPFESALRFARDGIGRGAA